MKTEKAIAAALEPLIDDLVALDKRVEALRLAPGPQGAPGKDADPADIAELLAEDREFVERVRGAPGAAGADGLDGVGIDTPQHVAGAVYREGTYVVANVGQTFVAMKDTASAPGDGDHWRRVGAGGFRHRGAFDKDAAYADGDLFIKDFGTFVIVRGAPVLLAGRGSVGKPGEPGARGERGEKGDAGADGATIIAAEAQGFRVVFVQRNGDGTHDNIECDFADAFRSLLQDALDVAMQETRRELAALRRELKRVTA